MNIYDTVGEALRAADPDDWIVNDEFDQWEVIKPGDPRVVGLEEKYLSLLRAVRNTIN